MNTSYQERNNWIELLVALWAIGYYLLTLATIEGGMAAELSYFLPFIIKVIVVSIVVGIVLAILNRFLSKDANDAKDEMDRMIDLRGFRNAYWVMSMAVMVVIFMALFNERMTELGEAPRIGTTNLMVHALFIVASLSGLVQSVTQIVYYRKGLV
ncbi:hypothetical protein IEN85_23030 [Pelagicoccus sp. NFK12]|uniref:Uncharacterized protein n=1 Tax=Pelagicoccus enzymogenes TaxID=2773457 RepID=A0A927FCB1_9BACT|nr:hypothetical protein [Pelagicoccus enzymogenes]MBD5782392.1 hypothetical protein [Pelagicoccus enzymogenes]MDQ8200976.1 hypothetical protein [Pelagicoccus enzymogenes]